MQPRDFFPEAHDVFVGLALATSIFGLSMLSLFFAPAKPVAGPRVGQDPTPSPFVAFCSNHASEMYGLGMWKGLYGTFLLPCKEVPYQKDV
jgi:hypothetical protein